MKLPVRRRRSKRAKALKAARSAPVKALGALALLVGIGAVIARMLKGGGEPAPFATAYEPPAGEPQG